MESPSENRADWNQEPDGQKSKRPWYRRWWAITAGVLVVLAFIGSLGEDTPGYEDTVAVAEANENPSDEPTQSAAEKEAERREAAEAAREAREAAAQERREERRAAAEERRAAAEAARKAKAARERAARREAARVNPATYRTVTDREYALIVKDPDSHVGEKVRVYGIVTQADAITGPTNLLADTSATPSSEWYDFDTNTLVSAPGRKLFSQIVEDDIVTFYVEVVGSYSYDTQIGGNTTVPHLQANIATVTGSG